MNKLGRNTWIGLGFGATAGISLVLFLVVYKKMKRRLCQSLSVPSNSDADFLNKDGASIATVSHVLEVQAGSSLEALAIRPKGGLLVEQQLALKNKLDEVLRCVACLRAEVGSLRGDLQDVAAHIVQDVKKGLEESQKVARRRRPPPRERADSASSSSVYFTARSRYDEESEGGYTTANGESDYYGEAVEEVKKDTEDEEDEDGSHVTECTLRRDSSGAETEEEEFSDAESPGDAEAPLPSRSSAVPSGGPQDEGQGPQDEEQGPQPCCPNPGVDVDSTSPEALKAAKDGKGALVS
ncbi:regulator of microtubule dynamics protein 3-like [Anguilla anguilla]|uniref:regulator of microtubule dynamics protein 3-like n=1 Tax=Anguilla anguilla TaxID=7936 RepID=UPI0015A876D6|nr:regulator of microtubule dynamics protein 3-like [Anguilla anguilla]